MVCKVCQKTRKISHGETNLLNTRAAFFQEATNGGIIDSGLQQLHLRNRSISIGCGSGKETRGYTLVSNGFIPFSLDESNQSPKIAIVI